MEQVLETKPVLSTDLPVFKYPGKYGVPNKKESSDLHLHPKPPSSLLIFTPSKQGSYPVILFFHGFCINNDSYQDLLRHISSHGYVIVAPMLYNVFLPISGEKEAEIARKVSDWLLSRPSGIPGANLDKLALSGHSRGGKIAFKLALDYAKTTSQKYDLLVGIDPVAGLSFTGEIDPKFFTYKPCSLNLSIPVTVIGTGLGPVRKGLTACAPEGLNHDEFFKECKPPRAHFVAKDFGHLDVLDDNIPDEILEFLLCKGCKGDKDPMRRCVGGIVVAFLNYYFQGQKEDFMTIVNNYKKVAPVVLDEVQFDTEDCDCEPSG